MKRPKRLPPPDYLTPSPPLPAPGPGTPEKEQLSPTRYGDWEKKGIAIDF